jgi:hypothetical protein
MFPVKNEAPRSIAMTRGHLSLRIDEANPSHHLYVNTGGRADGNYWVAYTLHFSGRKRRVRRSLGTKCLAEAIRLRDELFARVDRDGEDVPERRPEAAKEGEMSPRVTDIPDGSVASHLASA